MKADALFVILCIVMLYIAWVVTGGPSRTFSSGGAFITPVTRPGEQQQAYKLSAPVNPVDSRAYPTQVRGTASATSTPDSYKRTATPERTPGSPY